MRLSFTPTRAACVCLVWSALAACGDSTTPHPPAQVQPVSATALSGSVGQPLADSVAVRIADADGFALAGVQVTWTPAPGSGSVSPSSSTTGTDGIARTRWTLGTAAGMQALTASVPGVMQTAVFAATAAAGPAAAVVVTPSPTLQLTVGDQATLTASLQDAYGNPAGPAAAATWTSADPGVVESSGATVIGRGAGTARVTATVAGVGAGFTDVTVARPALASLSEGINVDGICALDAAGNAYCWGATAAGQATARPLRVPGGLHFTRVSAGEAASCGVTGAGQVWCWGRWQVNGTEIVTAAPVQATGGSAFSDVAMRSCGITAGDITCWESSGFGPFLLLAGDFRSLTSGGSVFCALDASGVPWCWGDNSELQLGRADQTGCLGGSSSRYCPSPAPIDARQPFVRIRTGLENSCGQAADGSSYCWGRGDYNLLQQPVSKACVLRVTQGGYRDACTATPLPIITTPALASLTPGWDAICGLTSAGQAYCWGVGVSGQLGNGSTADNPTPTAVVGGHTFTSLAAGGYFFCGIDTAGQVWCWGQNDHGQLGDGTTTDRAIPVAVF